MSVHNAYRCKQGGVRRTQVSSPFWHCALLVLLVLYLAPAHSKAIDDVKKSVQRIESTTNTINSNVSAIKSQTNLISPIRTSVQDVQGKLQDIPMTVQSAIGVSLDSEAKDEILNVIGMLKDTLAQQKTDLQSFGNGSPGTACYDFKVSMKALARDSVDTMFLIQSIGGSTIPAIPSGKINDIISLLDAVNCKLLLPAWLALTKTPVGELIDPLTETREALSAIMPLFDTTGVSLTATPPGPSQAAPTAQLTATIFPATCSNIENRRNYISGAALVLKKISLKMQVVGAKLDPMIFKGGGPIVDPAFRFGDKTVGIHGYGMMEIKKVAPPQPTKLAKLAQFIGKLLGETADWATMKVDACIDVENQNRLYRNQMILMTEVCSLSRFRSPACAAYK